MKNIVVALLVIVLTGISAYAQGYKKDVSAGYKVGDQAVDFELMGVDGDMHSLASIDGAKGYVVIFTGNTCPFAVANESRIKELHAKMAPKGYPVVAINSNQSQGDSYEDMVEKAQEEEFSFLYLRDEQGVYRTYGANKTPHVYLLDKDLIVRYIGAIDDSPQDPDNVSETFLANAIMAVDSGEDPEPSFTKAIGCPIKAGKSEVANRGGRRGPPTPAVLIERMDMDKDQMISKSEAQGPLANEFDQLDQNQDGKLSIEELREMKQPGRRM